MSYQDFRDSIGHLELEVMGSDGGPGGEGLKSPGPGAEINKPGSTCPMEDCWTFISCALAGIVNQAQSPVRGLANSMFSDIEYWKCRLH